jgi:hypothetical protein
VTNGGTGYAASSTFPVTLTGGTFTTAGVVNVTTDSSWIIRGISSVPTQGAYTAKPSGAVSVTGGTGTGATLTPYLSPFISTGVQVTNAANTQIQARNTQLRSAGMGSYAGIYDNFIDWNGISDAGSGLWVPYCTYDGVHAAPGCIIAKAAYAAPLIAQWAAIAVRK